MASVKVTQAFVLTVEAAGGIVKHRKKGSAMMARHNFQPRLPTMTARHDRGETMAGVLRGAA